MYFEKEMRKLSESMWADAHRKNIGIEARKEDEYRFNIKDFEEVDINPDFPVVFADRDLEVNGENGFTWDEVEKMIPEIEKTGWRLLKGHGEVVDLFYWKTQPPKPLECFTQIWNAGKGGALINKDTNEALVFDTDNPYGVNYWCNWSENDLVRIQHGSFKTSTARGFEVGEPKDYYGCLIRTNNFRTSDKCRIRLVKDK